jgi:hypothetical protein
MATFLRRVLFPLNAFVLAAALLLPTGCHKNTAPPVQVPEPFTAQLTEVDGVQAILSLRHPKLVNQDLGKLMVGVPETEMLRMMLSQTAPYGYPEFSDIAEGSNIGVAVLSLSGADLKAKSAVYVGFAKLKEGGKLWGLLNMVHLAIERKGEWVIFAKDAASLAKLKSPDGVIAYLEKPQAEDVRVWGRMSPEFLAGLRDLILPGFDSKIADLPADQQKAARGYFDAVHSLLSQLHSVDLSLGFDDLGFNLTESAQFLPESPIGKSLRYKPGPHPDVAGLVSADALGTMVIRQNPKSASDLYDAVFDPLIAVDFPQVSERLKEFKANCDAIMAAGSGGGAGAFDLNFTDKEGRGQLKPGFFYVLSGQFTKELVRTYAKSTQAITRDFMAFVARKAGSGAMAMSFPYTYAEDSLTVDGIAFDCMTLPAVVNGKELSRSTEYFGVVDGNFVMADSEATLNKHLPALMAKTALADGIQSPEGLGEIGRVAVNGAKLVDGIAAAAKLDLNDHDVKAQVDTLKADYAAGGPASLIITVSQAKGTGNLFVPYKFMETSFHLGQYMSAQNVNLFKLMAATGRSPAPQSSP